MSDIIEKYRELELLRQLMIEKKRKAIYIMLVQSNRFLTKGLMKYRSEYLNRINIQINQIVAQQLAIAEKLSISDVMAVLQE